MTKSEGIIRTTGNILNHVIKQFVSIVFSRSRKKWSERNKVYQIQYLLFICSTFFVANVKHTFDTTEFITFKMLLFISNVQQWNVTGTKVIALFQQSNNWNSVWQSHFLKAAKSRACEVRSITFNAYFLNLFTLNFKWWCNNTKLNKSNFASSKCHPSECLFAT